MYRPLACLVLSCLAGVAASADPVRIAYFQEWPTPNLVAKADGAYEAAFGRPVVWSAFDTGTQMSEALLAGAVDIAYSQGLAPFVTAIDAGAPLLAVGIAVEYPANDCVIRDGSGLDPAEPASFVGRTVALPLATMADYSFRLMTRALGVDPAGMTIVDRVPADAATALLAGDVDLACGFGALAMAKMYAAGPRLMSDARKTEEGIESFDVITVSSEFARAEPGLVTGFLDVTARANAAWRATPDQLVKLGRESGLDRSTLSRQLRDFGFPTVAEQREALFGPAGMAAITTIGNAFGSGTATRTRSDYAGALDPSFLP